MKIFTTQRTDFYVSVDSLEETIPRTSKEQGVTYKDLAPGLERNIFNREDFIEYLSLYEKLTGIEKRAILDAHGEDVSGKWTFYNGNKKLAVQNWIKRNEEKYSVIGLAVCNPGAHCPISKRSIVIFSYGDSYPAQSSQPFSLSSPIIGEIDANLINYEKNFLSDFLKRDTPKEDKFRQYIFEMKKRKI